jgi:sugar lactone lactonase YvrE
MVPDPPAPAGGRGGRGGSAAGAFVSFGSGWEPVTGGWKSPSQTAADPEGNLYVADPAGNRIFKVSSQGQAAVFRENTGGARALRVAADGRVYAAEPTNHRIVSWGSAGDEKLIARDVDATDLLITKSGNLYFTDQKAGSIHLIDTSGKRRTVYEVSSGAGLLAPGAMTLSPDQAFISMVDQQTRSGWSFQIGADGSLINGEPIYLLETSAENSMRGIEGVAMDSQGYLYIPTAIGIESSTPIGRVQAVIALPETTGVPSAVTFGGKDRDWLYVIQNKRVFRRRSLRQGAAVWDPGKPPKPGL